MKIDTIDCSNVGKDTCSNGLLEALTIPFRSGQCYAIKGPMVAVNPPY